MESSQVQKPSPSVPTVNLQPEVTVINNNKPHSSTIRLDPLVSSTLRLDPLNTSTLHLDPSSSSMLRPDPIRSSLPSLEPTSLSRSSLCLNSRTTSTPNLDPAYLHRDPPGSSGACQEPHTSRQTQQFFSYPKLFTAPSAVKTEEKVPRPSGTSPDTSPRVKGTPNHQNGSPIVVPLPDPPPNSCLKTGTQTNHKDSRSRSRVGRRVHFKLPEDEENEQSDASSRSDEDITQASVSKEPPPVLTKPKLWVEKKTNKKTVWHSYQYKVVWMHCNNIAWGKKSLFYMCCPNWVFVVHCIEVKWAILRGGGSSTVSTSSCGQLQFIYESTRT